MENNIIIQEMYKGETRRDASSKIRGFLFQDLVAISKLLEKETIYIIPEYIEDIFVYTEKRIYILQVKYYAKATIKQNDIIRDLYYQYLRFEIKKYAGIIIPVLFVHSTDTITKPSLCDLQGKGCIDVDRDERIEDKEDIEQWLTNNVYSKKKDDAATKLFETFANNESMKSFLNSYKIESEDKVLKEYREDVSNQLVNAIQLDGCVIKDKEKQKSILLGLAIQYIQQKYNESTEKTKNFEKRKCWKKNFLNYLNDTMKVENDCLIGAYLRSVVIRCWEQIQSENDALDKKTEQILEYVRDATAQWLYELGSDSSGQIRLLNTVSLKSQNDLEHFCELPMLKRQEMMCEHFREINDFLKYLWKIMLDINYEWIDEEKKISDEDIKRLMPQTYVCESNQKYICLKFPGDNDKNTVILANILGAPKANITRIFGRMKEFQPQKWYMKGNRRGSYLYKMDISQIKRADENGYKVSEVESDKFEIECMQCIDIDENGWEIREKCEDCIFNSKCVKSTEDSI